MKTSVVFAVVAAASSAAFAVAPTIREGSVTFHQNANRLVTIKYILDGAPGIVTLDIETNRTGAATNNDADWVSIGGENIQGVSGGAVNCLVENLGENRMFWRADQSWPDHKVRGDAVRARVTAWSTNTPPNYLVVDLTGEEAPAYYTDAAFLPNGGLANNCYRDRYMVMRKIPAAGVKWRMGTPSGTLDWDATMKKHWNSEQAHAVVLTNDYYMGVFMVTRSQYANSPCTLNNDYQYDYSGVVYHSESEKPYCPRPFGSWKQNMARGNTANSNWPIMRHKVQDGSYIANLRAKTGVDFDLPTEAQWEFACRAGSGAVFYDGTTPTDRVQYENALQTMAWCALNSKTDDGKSSSAATSGVSCHRVGNLAPNAWGLYDMIGNMWEQCLDLYADANFNPSESVSYEPEGPSDASATSVANSIRVHRGGHYNDQYYQFRSARRMNSPNGSYLAGIRLMCPVTLKFPESEK